MMETDARDYETMMKHIESLHKENESLTKRLKAVRSASDQLLTAEEAAELLRVSTDYLYRNRRWATLPFTIVLSKRKILFSRNGIIKYMEEKRNAGQSV